jgi:hypothetical protein
LQKRWVIACSERNEKWLEGSGQMGGNEVQRVARME